NDGTGRYVYRQGAQIVDWTTNALAARGRVTQSGSVERAIAFRDRVLSISTEQLQVIDARDRDRPVVTANLFLVRNVLDVFSIGGYSVQLAAAEDDNSHKFFVLPFGENDMAKSAAELPIDGYVSYPLRAGNIVYVIGQNQNDGSQFIRAADFSDPLHPV